MQVQIEPSRPCGTVAAPPSKSMAHRLLVCAALAQGVSRIHGLATSEDILATIDCLRALGAQIIQEENDWFVKGISRNRSEKELTLPCRESGSTLRFLIPYALSLQKTVRFVGSERLMQRPQDVYSNLCACHDWQFVRSEDSITVCGAMDGGEYHVAADISSQFISGLLFYLPLAEKESRIVLKGTVESKAYIDMTLQAMKSFGVNAEWENKTTLYIPAGQTYSATNLAVEGDYSNAAFMEALNCFGNTVTVTGLSKESLQGDRVYKDCFEALAKKNPVISLAQCPDLGPVLFAMAAAQNGAIFTDVSRLRIKESDRIATMVEELSKFGTKFEITPDRVAVIADDFHAPHMPLYGHNDHRVVMALSVLLTKTGGTIHGAQAVSKSYPNFFSDLESLGVILHATD